MVIKFFLETWTRYHMQSSMKSINYVYLKVCTLWSGNCVLLLYIDFCFFMLDSSSLHQTEACAAMTTTVPVGIWSFINCKTKQKFICETLRDGYTTTIISPPTTPPLMCPDNWITIDNNCFKVFCIF